MLDEVKFESGTGECRPDTEAGSRKAGQESDDNSQLGERQDKPQH